ncbi:hypothetical protein L7F22_053953 [Adiantum nelumboides]|nr:hypothetical protein [Adiantum nelumboides]
MDRGGGSFVDPVQRAVRQSDQELQNQSSICLLDAVPRPDNGGREGRPIPVFANLFSTKFNPELQITQFDVRFVQTKDTGSHGEIQSTDVIFTRPIMLKMFTLALTKIQGLTENQIKAIVYDGCKNAFTCTNLPFQPGNCVAEVEVPQLKGEKRVGHLTMIIKQTNRFDIKAIQDFISAKAEFIKKFQKTTTESVGRFLQAFNIAFRMDALEQCVTTKNDKFFDSFNAKPIAQGAEIWSGFYQSVLPLRGGVFVNLDLAFSTFLCKGPLLEVAKKILENLPAKNNHYGAHTGRGGGRGNGFRGQDTMMIGIDVRHPPARLQHDSVVAAVATLNGQGTRIGSQISTQFNPSLGHQQETVLDGKYMFIGLLKSWKKFNGDHLPKQIIVFRDGVSQGEYMQVKEFEVTQLKQACLNTNSANDPTPKVVYVIATKKHHIRMFAKNERDLHDRKNGNLPAGTVADQIITHPFIFEYVFDLIDSNSFLLTFFFSHRFYLQAHTGIGCCRPCKYTVLQDEVHFTSDEIQRLINSLCYSHQRATRSVSRPPLVMYAHLLAYKAMFLLYPDIGSDLSSLGGSVRNNNLAGYSIEDIQKRLNMQNVDLNKAIHVNLVDNFSEVPWFL